MRKFAAQYSQIALIFAISILVNNSCVAEQGNDSFGKNQFLLGGDISALAAIEAHDGKYRDHAGSSDLIRILSENGCNCARLRLFVDPNQRNMVVNDLEYTLALAKRIHEAGLSLLLDIHYSDTWADPGKQYKPASWKSLTFEQLVVKVREYTNEVISEFRNNGVMPEIVQIGNEVSNGMLWPDGKLQFGTDKAQENKSWERFCKLLKAGIEGVREAEDSSHPIKIMVHIDRGCDWPKTKYFFDHLSEQNVQFDMIGQSFYPWWHGGLAELQENLKSSAKRYQKPIAVVETGYPYRGDQWKEHSSMDWSVSPEGQAKFLQDVIRVTRATPNGLGVGVMYWYPEAIPVDGLHIWEGGSVGLFNRKGEALPAIKAFQNTIPETSMMKSGVKK